MQECKYCGYPRNSSTAKQCAECGHLLPQKKKGVKSAIKEMEEKGILPKELKRLVETPKK
jgi:uncharacterized membrane protein YvbJ